MKDADITIDIQVEHGQMLFDGSLKNPKHYNIAQDLDWCYIVKTKNVLHEKQYQSNEQIVLTDNWVSIILVQHVIGLLKPFCHAAAIDTKNNKDRRLEYSLQFLHDSSIFCDSF